MAQYHGTGGIGKIGWSEALCPVYVACDGFIDLAAVPAVPAAFNPLHGLRLLLGNGWLASVVLGAAVQALPAQKRGTQTSRTSASGRFFSPGFAFPALSTVASLAVYSLQYAWSGLPADFRRPETRFYISAAS